MADYFLGIDNSGTLSKAVLFSETGAQLESASAEIDMITPSSGFTERDLEELWAITARAIKETVIKSGLDPGSIKDAACTGHGKGLYLWEKTEGHAAAGLCRLIRAPGSIPDSGNRTEQQMQYTEKPSRRF